MRPCSPRSTSRLWAVAAVLALATAPFVMAASLNGHATARSDATTILPSQLRDAMPAVARVGGSERSVERQLRDRLILLGLVAALITVPVLASRGRATSALHGRASMAAR